MSAFEQAQLAAIETYVSLESNVGPLTASMLRKGHKIAFEGVANPGLSHADWLSWLRHFLTDAAR